MFAKQKTFFIYRHFFLDMEDCPLASLLASWIASVFCFNQAWSLSITVSKRFLWSHLHFTSMSKTQVGDICHLRTFCHDTVCGLLMVISVSCYSCFTGLFLLVFFPYFFFVFVSCATFSYRKKWQKTVLFLIKKTNNVFLPFSYVGFEY